MANLEKTMQAALSFAGGGEESNNSLWIVCILLGRMIRERTEIGRAIKSLAKFQRREIMRGLVKLGDLEDLANPPCSALMPPHRHPNISRMRKEHRGMLRTSRDPQVEASCSWKTVFLGFHLPL